MIARSLDGGESLPMGELVFDQTLVDPAVAAGALQKEGVLYFTNPANSHSRVDLTLRWSLNRGKSWVKDTLKIWAGPSGYSCLAALKGNGSLWLVSLRRSSPPAQYLRQLGPLLRCVLHINYEHLTHLLQSSVVPVTVLYQLSGTDTPSQGKNVLHK
ncbi:sialidase-1-like [Xyrauchen texanus]|uniref:sialidase-1-like n=1 Tax=Xyrauchen texanus TaxID=154827 RepID=UPI002241A9E9|nr:sialidase-1-like [Xyrauchen texanus]